MAGLVGVWKCFMMYAGIMLVVWLASALFLGSYGAQAQAISCYACGVRGKGEGQFPPCVDNSPGIKKSENCIGRCYVMFNKKHAMTYGDTAIAKGCTDLSYIRLDDGSDGPCGMLFGDRLNTQKGYNLTYFVPLCLCKTNMCNQNNSACHYSPDNCIDPFPWANDKCRRRRGFPMDWCLAKPPSKNEGKSEKKVEPLVVVLLAAFTLIVCALMDLACMGTFRFIWFEGGDAGAVARRYRLRQLVV